MSSLRESVDALVAVGVAAGLSEAAIRREALDFAAAISEAAPRAAADWVGALDAPPADLDGIHREFFDAASRGRKYRVAATTLLTELLATGQAKAKEYAVALTEVASAAASLGEPSIRVTANAAGAAASQLQAANPTGSMPRVGDSLPGWPSTSATPGMPPIWPTPSLTPMPGDPSSANQGGFGGPGGGPGGGVAAAAPPEPAAPTAPAPPPEPQKSLDELLGELDAMIGLDQVKRVVHQQVAMLQIDAKRQAAGLKRPDITRHLVFVGNPGTGKTTVARMVGGIYRALGLLKTGQLVEVDRSELVAGYLGQTAIKTAEMCAKAYGGVLFVDEAYSLSGDQYGQEAVNTLVKEMEDHRDDLVVIVAGYPDPMVVFIAQNPGLASRFKTIVEFHDYSDDELVEILHKLASAADYTVEPEAEAHFRTVLAATPRNEAFGNGRFARNALEDAIARQAWRLRDDPDLTADELRALTLADFSRDPEAAPQQSSTDKPPADDEPVDDEPLNEPLNEHPDEPDDEPDNEPDNELVPEQGDPA